MNIKRLLWILPVFFLVILPVSLAADDFKTSLNPIVNEIFKDQFARYELTITSEENASDTYYLKLNDPKWSIEMTPSHYMSGMDIPAGGSVLVTMYLKPSSTLSYGLYNVKMELGSDKLLISKIIEVPVRIKSTTPEITNYVPSLNVDFDVPAVIDPREEVAMTVNLKNLNPLNIKDLAIEVKSKLYSTSKKSSLEPLSVKTEAIKFNYDALQKPTKDVINVAVKIGKYTFKALSKEISIKSYSTIKESSSLAKYFLKSIETRTYKNDGNVEVEKTIRVETSLFQQLFTKAAPKADKVKAEGIRYLEWKQTFMPQETKTITVEVNYRPLVIVFALIIIGVILYYAFRSPVIIKKGSTGIRRENEGISSVKVLIHIKNRTKNPIDSLQISDRLPQIAHLEKDFIAGTMKPDKILHHEQKGLMMKWSLPLLEPYEERIITYSIKSKLKILGSLRLPKASLRFKNKRGNYVNVNSNRLSVG